MAEEHGVPNIEETNKATRVNFAIYISAQVLDLRPVVVLKQQVCCKVNRKRYNLPSHYCRWLFEPHIDDHDG